MFQGSQVLSLRYSPLSPHLQNRGKRGVQGIGASGAPTIWVSGQPIRELGARFVSSSSPEREGRGLREGPGLGPDTAQMHDQKSPQHRQALAALPKRHPQPQKTVSQGAPMPGASFATSDLASPKVREMPWASDPCHSSPNSDHEEMMLRHSGRIRGSQW